MSNINIESTNTAATVENDLSAELSELLADASPATAEQPLVVSEESLDEVESELVMLEAKSEAYEEAEAEVSTSPTGDAVTPTTAATPKSKPAKVRKLKAPRVTLTSVGGKPSNVLIAIYDAPSLRQAAMLLTTDDASVDQTNDLLNVVDGLAKKIGIKALNLIKNVSNPAKIERFTQIGLDLINGRSTVSSKDVIDHLRANGYSIGTARSQGNQLMTLLPALKIATKSGRTLEINRDSALLARYNTARAAA